MTPSWWLFLLCRLKHRCRFRCLSKDFVPKWFPHGQDLGQEKDGNMSWCVRHAVCPTVRYCARVCHVPHVSTSASLCNMHVLFPYFLTWLSCGIDEELYVDFIQILREKSVMIKRLLKGETSQMFVTNFLPTIPSHYCRSWEKVKKR